MCPECCNPELWERWIKSETPCTLLSAYIFQEYNCMKNIKEHSLITYYQCLIDIIIFGVLSVIFSFELFVWMNIIVKTNVCRNSCSPFDAMIRKHVPQFTAETPFRVNRKALFACNVRPSLAVRQWIDNFRMRILYLSCTLLVISLTVETAQFNFLLQDYTGERYGES